MDTRGEHFPRTHNSHSSYTLSCKRLVWSLYGGVDYRRGCGILLGAGKSTAYGCFSLIYKRRKMNSGLRCLTDSTFSNHSDACTCWVTLGEEILTKKILYHDISLGILNACKAEYSKILRFATNEAKLSVRSLRAWITSPPVEHSPSSRYGNDGTLMMVVEHMPLKMVAQNIDTVYYL